MKRYTLIIALMLLTSLITSCTKSKESKLEGKWRKIEVSNVDAVKPISVWEFNSGTVTFYTKPVGQADLIEVSKANYTLGFNGTSYTFNITQEVSGEQLYYLKGDGKIVKLSDDQFKYINENGFYAEFVRY